MEVALEKNALEQNFYLEASFFTMFVSKTVELSELIKNKLNVDQTTKN